jgi:hypothetical protein
MIRKNRKESPLLGGVGKSFGFIVSTGDFKVLGIGDRA